MSNQAPRVFAKVPANKNQPTKGPPYPKVKYSDAKMRDVIPNLPLFECLKIEYRAKGVWFKMISKRNNMYNCECCGVENVGITPICDHVRGKKHRLALQAADKLFHPQYTAPRPSKSPARTPILDAYLSSDGKRNDTEYSSEQKSKPGPASATQKPKPGPASASAQKPGTASASAQKPGPSSAQKPAPASAQKPAPASAQKLKPESDGAAQPKPSGTQKPGPASSKKPMNATSKPASAAGPVDQNASTAVSKPTEATNSAESKEKTPVESKDKSRVENADNKKSPETTRKPETITEIVVLDDDDDDDVPAQQQSSSNANTSQNDTVGRAIPVAGTAVPKSQRLPRRVLNPQAIVHQQQNIANEANKGSTIPSANRILNPAAVVAQTAEQRNDENKPQYQQNRVIIPSVNKKRDLQNQKPKGNAQPNFSKKSFSPKISSSELEGIIGVEYVVKILKVYNDPDPFYECCLCEVVMDGIGMQTHLLGYNHRYKYIEKHFTTCFNQYKDHIGNIQVMGVILDRIAQAIEAHHGRELPYECLSGEFRSNRHGVMTTVYSFRHASEYSGPSFTNVVDAKQVDELVKNKITYNPPKPDPKRKPTFDTRVGAPVAKKVRVERDREPERERPFPPPSSGRGNNGRRGDVGGPSSRRPYRAEQENIGTTNTLDDATHKLMVEEFLQHTRGRSRSPGGRRRRQRSRSRSPHRSHRRESRRSPSPLREGDIWQAYRHLVDRSKNELDQMYKEYRKDPEKHPVYNEEWRKFWKHRKDQLSREGLDHRNYDFQPEWVRYFAVRIEELYDEALEDIKISSRRRLILPMTNDELEDKKYHIKQVVAEVEQTPKTEQHSNPDQPSFPKPNTNTSVVSVLRLLTALEDYLGSLGPKVVDLLSQALLVEKTNPREINEIILNLENCTILETAMEKLKGVLIAGLLEGPKVRAFNNVILETDKILRIGYKIRQENPQPQMRRPNPQPVPAPKDKQSAFQQKPLSPQRNTGSAGGGGSSGAAASLLSQIDKKELATKLAAALTAQGKTDFNPEQLQQLIAVYSLIDKKKRDSAAASDKQKMTLSDTLTALLNPSSDKSGDARDNSPQPLLTNRMGGGRNYLNSNDKFGPVNNSSINNLVNILNRDNMSADGSANAGDSEMWQNLQNIQSSLRSQNNLSSGEFGNNSGNTGRGFGTNSMGVDNMSSAGGGGGNFNNTGGFGGSSGKDFNSGQNFRSGANRNDDLEAGFRAGFQGMNSNPSRAGGNDNMISGGRGVNDMLGNGSRIRNDAISRGRGGNDMMTGGRGGGGSNNNNNFSGGNTNSGGSNFSMGATTGMRGANNTLGFARTSFLGGGSGSGISNFTSGFSGLSNFSTSIGLSSGNTFQRSSLGGMGGGGGGNSGSNMGGSNFNRGNVTAPSNFGLGNTSGNFNNQPNNNNSGGGQTFGSAPNQRNMGGNNNTQSGRAGSNWRNQ